MKRVLLVMGVLILATVLVVPGALAADYPTKPITVIVPWGAGGMSTATGRMLTDHMKKALGKPIVLVNKPGASGVVGLQAIVKAKSDGYSLGSGAFTLAFTAPYFLDAPTINIDQVTFIGSYTPQERVLFTTPDKPYKTWQEFIAYAKAHPGEVSVGSGGAQWALEVMKAVAKKEGIQFKYVMFKGGGAASSAILGGHVDVCETGTGTPAYQSAREGKLVLLADLGAEKVPYFPDAPNMIDLGYEYSTLIEYGLVGPAGMPEEIRAKIEAAMQKALEDKTLVENLTKMGFGPRFLPGARYKEICQRAVQSIPELKEYVKDVK